MKSEVEIIGDKLREISSRITYYEQKNLTEEIEKKLAPIEESIRQISNIIANQDSQANNLIALVNNTLDDHPILREVRSIKKVITWTSIFICVMLLAIASSLSG